MRLGDLDALKDYAFEVYQGNGVELKTLMVVPLCEIDNAPTLPNEYMRGYEAAERQYKKPQGEWIEGISNSTPNNYCKCSNCNFVVWNYVKFNFCPNCGSYNRGKEE